MEQQPPRVGLGAALNAVFNHFSKPTEEELMNGASGGELEPNGIVDGKSFQNVAGTNQEQTSGMTAFENHSLESLGHDSDSIKRELRVLELKLANREFDLMARERALQMEEAEMTSALKERLKIRDKEGAHHTSTLFASPSSATSRFGSATGKVSSTTNTSPSKRPGASSMPRNQLARVVFSKEAKPKLLPLDSITAGSTLGVGTFARVYTGAVGVPTAVRKLLPVRSDDPDWLNRQAQVRSLVVHPNVSRLFGVLPVDSAAIPATNDGDEFNNRATTPQPTPLSTTTTTGSSSSSSFGATPSSTHSIKPAQRGVNGAFVEELIVGRSIHERLHSPQSRMPLQECLAFAMQIADACAHLHSLKIAYCELNPRTILIDSTQRPDQIKLGGFSCAARILPSSSSARKSSSKDDPTSSLVLVNPSVSNQHQPSTSSVVSNINGGFNKNASASSFSVVKGQSNSSVGSAASFSSSPATLGHKKNGEDDGEEEEREEEDAERSIAERVLAVREEVVKSCRWDVIRTSPAYAAPELLLSEGEAGMAADQYSFAILLWEMLTSEVPFRNLSIQQLTETVAIRRVRPPIPRDCPVALADILRECWSHQPQNRPAFVTILGRLKRLWHQLKSVPELTLGQARTAQVAASFGIPLVGSVGAREEDGSAAVTTTTNSLSTSSSNVKKITAPSVNNVNVAAQQQQQQQQLGMMGMNSNGGSNTGRALSSQQQQQQQVSWNGTAPFGTVNPNSSRMKTTSSSGGVVGGSSSSSSSSNPLRQKTKEQQMMAMMMGGSAAAKSASHRGTSSSSSQLQQQQQQITSGKSSHTTVFAQQQQQQQQQFFQQQQQHRHQQPATVIGNGGGASSSSAANQKIVKEAWAAPAPSSSKHSSGRALQTVIGMNSSSSPTSDPGNVNAATFKPAPSTVTPPLGGVAAPVSSNVSAAVAAAPMLKQPQQQQKIGIPPSQSITPRKQHSHQISTFGSSSTGAAASSSLGALISPRGLNSAAYQQQQQQQSSSTTAGSSSTVTAAQSSVISSSRLQQKQYQQRSPSVPRNAHLSATVISSTSSPSKRHSSKHSSSHHHTVLNTTTATAATTTSSSGGSQHRSLRSLFTANGGVVDDVQHAHQQPPPQMIQQQQQQQQLYQQQQPQTFLQPRQSSSSSSSRQQHHHHSSSRPTSVPATGHYGGGYPSQFY